MNGINVLFRLKATSSHPILKITQASSSSLKVVRTFQQLGEHWAVYPLFFPVQAGNESAQSLVSKPT